MKFTLPGFGELDTEDPRVGEQIQTTRLLLSRALRISQALYYARGGTALDTGLALASMVGEGLAELYPSASPFQTLGTMGMTQRKDLMELRPLVQSILLESGLPTKTRTFQEYAVTLDIIYDQEGNPLCAICDQNHHITTIWVHDDADDAFHQILRHGFWGDSLQLEAVLGDYQASGDRPLQLLPMGPPAHFLGDPPLEWYVKRLEPFQKLKENRTIRLLGPTGSGKTTLARILGRTLKGSNAKTLLVSSEALNSLRPSTLVSLCALLSPDVLILDDFAVGEKVNNSHLVLLDRLHKAVPLTVLTHMTEANPSAAKNRLTGIRPGRIDRTFVISLPSAPLRRKLVAEFWGGEEALKLSGLSPEQIATLVEKTEGISGAYLEELVKRLRAMGPEAFEEEVEWLLSEVQPAEENGEEEEEEEGGGKKERVAGRRNGRGEGNFFQARVAKK